MNHESISYNNELFIPFRVDKTKFIIENLDEKLEKDILNLYAENLIQDVQHFKCTVDYLCNNLFLVNCDKEIGNFLFHFLSYTLKVIKNKI